MRIEPFPIPRIGVVMNRAKRPGGSSTRGDSNETQRYLEDAEDVLKSITERQQLKAKLFETTIPDRVGIKRAIQEGMPSDLHNYFQNLWKEVKEFINER